MCPTDHEPALGAGASPLETHSSATDTASEITPLAISLPPPTKAPGEATTIAIVATDAALTRAQALRLAIAGEAFPNLLALSAAGGRTATRESEGGNRFRHV